LPSSGRGEGEAGSTECLQKAAVEALGAGAERLRAWSIPKGVFDWSLAGDADAGEATR
jgi:hypothetical protein